MDGRREKRSLRKLEVLLSDGAHPMLAEYASTENVSPYGARIRTDRHWKADTRVLVKSFQGELWARAKVVYCQTLPGKAFALGLEFLARTGEWASRL